MTAKNLSTLSQDFIDAYGNTARNVIQAYRASGERVAGFVEQRWERALEQSRSQLLPEVHNNAKHAQRVLGSYYVKGLAFTTNGADTVVDQLVSFAGQGVQQVAANAARFEEKTGMTLDRFTVAVAPVATAVTKLATQIEQKSGELASKIAANTGTAKRVSPFKKARAQKAA
jgi:hypothetical protein